MKVFEYEWCEFGAVGKRKIVNGKWKMGVGSLENNTVYILLLASSV
jgi:hypothetical protein